MKKTLPIFLLPLTITLAMALHTTTARSVCLTLEKGCKTNDDCGPCCICFNGYCIPNPLRQLPPNTPSTGTECCGRRPVPEDWMCCEEVIYKPYDFTDTIRIKIAKDINIGVASGKADGYVVGKETRWNECCKNELKDFKTYVGGGMFEIKGRKEWPKISLFKFVFEGGGRVNLNARFENTCENENWCTLGNTTLFVSAGAGAGDPNLILLDAGFLGEAILLGITICVDAETFEITKLEIPAPTGCIYFYYRFTSDLLRISHRRTYPTPFTPHCRSENTE